MFGSNNVKKVVKIDGMSCMHCVKKVEESLKSIKEVKSVKVILEDKKAEITLKENIDNKILEENIKKIGYEPIEIQDY